MALRADPDVTRVRIGRDGGSIVAGPATRRPLAILQIHPRLLDSVTRDGTGHACLLGKV